jgi:phosphatidate cytidylyltransferase
METPADTPSKPEWKDLKTRVFSALVMVAAFLIVEITGGMVFAAVVMVAGLIMLREWDALIHQAHFQDNKYFSLGGLAYIALPCLSMIWLRSLHTETSPNAGMGIVFYLVLVIAATDIGAYFAGKTFGGAKLAPSISPSKTWAGLFGGMVAAAMIGLLCAVFTGFPTTVKGCILTAMLLAVVSQAGDLFESWLKRKAGVKDSGTLIPGHGGLLDRLDGFMTATPVFAALAWLGGLGA